MPADRDRLQQAAAWCAKVSDGALSLEDQLQLEIWLDESADNEEAFRKTVVLWNSVPETAEMAEMISVRADALEAMRAANEARWKPRLISSWKPALAMAASLALVALLSLTLLYDPVKKYETDISERRVVQLDDGSRLSLDAASSVEVDFDDDKRALRLVSGRAKFDVAKNAGRPFTVRAGDKLVRATGTSFSVELVKDQVRVILYEGGVEVIDAEEDAQARPDAGGARGAVQQLRPGNELVSVAGQQASLVTQADLPQSLEWQMGQLTFTDERLDVAVERVNRYSSHKIVIRDEALRNQTISGAFNAGDPTAFIDGVTMLFPAKARQNGGAIELVSRN